MKKILIFGLIIRLISIYLFRNISNYDLQSYLQVGELTLKGINIYPHIANLHHPYLPFFLYIEAFAFYLGISIIDPIIFIKIINVIFDLGIVYLVYLLSKKNLKTAYLYAINPVTILITTLHGQFDIIPIFFILLSIYLLEKKNQLGGILSYSFAILTKTWPVLFIIPILRKSLTCHSRGGGNPGHQALDPLLQGDDKSIKWKMLLLILFFPVLFSLVYIFLFKSSLISISKTLAHYQGLWGIWGLFGLLGKQRILFQKLTTLIFLISFFSYSYYNKKKDLIMNILNLLFFFFIFTPNFSIQYFAWIMPFLILIRPKKYLFLIALIAIYLFSSYYFWLFCFGCKNIPIWLLATQNFIGFILWLSFIKIGYLLKKMSDLKLHKYNYAGYKRSNT